MRDNAPSYIKISYYSSCVDGKNLIKTNKCEVKVGDIVTFTIQITVTSCPANRKDWKQTIEVYPVGLDESMTIDLEMLCDCDCEHESNGTLSEQQCQGNGQYKCGVCECDEFHSGKTCECDM